MNTNELTNTIVLNHLVFLHDAGFQPEKIIQVLRSTTNCNLTVAEALINSCRADLTLVGQFPLKENADIFVKSLREAGGEASCTSIASPGEAMLPSECRCQS